MLSNVIGHFKCPSMLRRMMLGVSMVLVLVGEWVKKEGGVKKDG